MSWNLLQLVLSERLQSLQSPCCCLDIVLTSLWRLLLSPCFFKVTSTRVYFLVTDGSNQFSYIMSDWIESAQKLTCLKFALTVTDCSENILLQFFFSRSSWKWMRGTGRADEFNTFLMRYKKDFRQFTTIFFYLQYFLMALSRIQVWFFSIHQIPLNPRQFYRGIFFSTSNCLHSIII